MQYPIAKPDFFADLVGRIHEHEKQVRADFQPMTAEQLSQSPQRGEWSILQCIDHLNQTHDYYNRLIVPVLADSPPRAAPQADFYKPSFWGGIYMRFAFNPRFSFPAPANTSPGSALDVAVLDAYLTNLQGLLNLLEEVEAVDLCRTRIPIKGGMVQFNLGDCLKTMVYHDALHLDQAQRVRRKLA